MKIVEPGHVYALSWLDGEPWTAYHYPDGNDDPDVSVHEDHLIFVNREEGSEHGGTQTQEVLRALIDRTMHCDNCLPWNGNAKIIHHLRMALALHEARALERKAEKGYYEPERVAKGDDGHFTLNMVTRNPTSDAMVYKYKDGE